MGDPYDLSGIRRVTPDPLGLDSLRAAIPDEYNDGDVTMEDAPLEPSDSRGDTKFGGIEVQGSERENNRFRGPELEPDPSNTPSESKKDLQITTRDGDKTPEPSSERSFSLLSPTQLGAHMAVDTAPRHNEGGYEIRMPIPAPWHHNLPYILSTYLQLGFNSLMVVLAAWIVLRLRHDVDIKVSERSATIMREAARCREQYLANRCHPGAVVPHLMQSCAEWEECMERDPSDVRWLSAQAATLAEICNDFLEALTFRTLVVLGTGGLLIVFAANYLFGFLRARALYPIQIQHPPLRPLNEALFKKH